MASGEPFGRTYSKMTYILEIRSVQDSIKAYTLQEVTARFQSRHKLCMFKNFNTREKYKGSVSETRNSPFNTDNQSGFLQSVRWWFLKLEARYVVTQAV
jgi:hypothetical protein